jgi:hypothetical protein
MAPGMPPILDQGSSPMGVAYSSSAMKAWQDRRDQERFFDFDEPKFFGQIGAPDASKEKADLMHAIYDRITVAGPEIVSVRLTQAAYAHGLALALPEKVEMARPTGVGRGRLLDRGPRRADRRGRGDPARL